jgi:hypothetical protein
MTTFGKLPTWSISGLAAISLISLSAAARAEVLFDSLSGKNSGVVGDDFFSAARGGLPLASTPTLLPFA